jgi:hypothetical protein
MRFLQTSKLHAFRTVSGPTSVAVARSPALMHPAWPQARGRTISVFVQHFFWVLAVVHPAVHGNTAGASGSTAGAPQGQAGAPWGPREHRGGTTGTLQEHHGGRLVLCKTQRSTARCAWPLARGRKFLTQREHFAQGLHCVFFS